MQIIVDTREQKPLFEDCDKLGLLVGDYTTKKLLKRFAIERKSLPDLYQTITKGHVRFRREILRAEANDILLVMVVEGTKDQFINKKWPGGDLRKMSGEILEKIINTVERRYLLKVIWCKDRPTAKRIVVSQFKKYEATSPLRIRNLIRKK